MLSSLAPTKKYFLIMFLISCILLEAFTLVIYFQSRANKHSNDWVIHSYQTLRIGRLVMSDAVDLANQEQGYVLTGYQSYLTSYKSALFDLNAQLDALAKVNADSPDQQNSMTLLRDSAERLKRICASHINALQKKQVSVYSLKSGTHATKEAVSDVRDTFEAFSQSESQLLDERTRHANNEQQNYLWTLFMGGILGFGALVIANLVIFNLIARNSRAEAKLKKTEELFSIVLTGINDGIYDQDMIKGTIDYSTSYESMLGYSKKELGSAQEDFSALIHPDDVNGIHTTFQQYITHEIPTYNTVFRLKHKDGHWVWVLSRGVGIWDENGKIQRMIGAHTDITRQKKYEEELKYFIEENEHQRHELAQSKEKAESANQAKSDFLATMSHEIRTPMNVVIGLARLLLETSLDSKQRQMTETLGINADILLQLVNDLLDLSRIESGQVELESRSFTFEDTFKAVDALFRGQATEKGLTFSLINNVGNQTFIGDPMRVQQILVNLISNALKFTSSGEISVISEYELQKNDATEIRITVADTGVGISSDKLPTIFDKFVQADQTISRRFGGSGLGLSICLSLAKLMNGDIKVTSKPGKGSSFTFSLPLHLDRQKKVKETATALAPPSHKAPNEGTILIVEDYAANVMVASMMLEHLGYRVEVAANGAEALKKVEESTTPYTAILMDVQMQGMDGLETTKRIRALEAQKGYTHFIIGATAHALAGDRDRCLEAGMDEYMSKPINVDLLSQKLQHLPRAA